MPSNAVQTLKMAAGAGNDFTRRRRK